MAEPTPYDRARTLLESGASPTDAVRALVDGGMDREGAQVVVSALCAKQVLPMSDLGEATIDVRPPGSSPALLFGLEDDTAFDAQLNLVFGLLTAVGGVGVAILWASGYQNTLPLFTLLLLAAVRINLRQMWWSLGRVVAAVLIVFWEMGMLALGAAGGDAVASDRAWLTGAVVTFALGAAYAVRGLIVLFRLQRKVKAGVVTPGPAAAPAEAASPTAEQPPAAAS